MIPLLPEMPALPTPAAAGPGVGAMVPELPGGEAGASDFAALLGALLPAASAPSSVLKAGAGPLPAPIAVLPEVLPEVLPGLAAETPSSGAGLPGAAPSAAPSAALETAPSISPSRLPTGRILPPQGASLPRVRLAETELPQALPGTARLAPANPATVPNGGPAASAPSAPSAPAAPAATATAALVDRALAPRAAGPAAPDQPETATDEALPVAGLEQPILADAAPTKPAAPLPSLHPAPERAQPRLADSPQACVEQVVAAPRPAELRAAAALTRPLTLAGISPEALPGEAIIEDPAAKRGAPVAAAPAGDDAEAASDWPEADPDSLAAAGLPVAIALPIPPLPIAAPPAPATASEPAALAPVSAAPVARAAVQPLAVPMSAAPEPIVMPPQHPAEPAAAPTPRPAEPLPSALRASVADETVPAAADPAVASAPQAAPAPAKAGSEASIAPSLATMTAVPALAQAAAAGPAPVVAAPRRVAPPPPSPAVPPPPGDSAQLGPLAAALPDPAPRDDAAASPPTSAAPSASTLLAAAAPPPALADRPDPRAPAPTSPAPTPPAPQQQSTIDQVGDLREALRAQRPAMMLNHTEFGAVSLRLEGSGHEGWRAVLASRDPGFVPAIQAALAERVVAASTPAPDSGASFAGQQQGAFQNGTGDHRSGSSPSGGQGSPQPYLGQSGSRDGEAAPDHRRPSTTAALAARAEAEDGGPGGHASPAGGLFA